MERVLKRVGLSRRSLAPTADEEATAPTAKNQRRRRRSKSRRRSAVPGNSNTTITTTTTNSSRPGGATSAPAASAQRSMTGASTMLGFTSAKKPAKARGLFSFDWDAVRDCRSCKSRALLSKRFCSRKCDNELYRSNSFKFERFVRGDGDTDGVSTLGKKISLCDDYSIPLDDVNRRRPNSIAAPSASDWNISSPNEDRVEVLETYSTPRDFKQRLSHHEELEWEREFTAAAVAAAASASGVNATNADDTEQKCFTSPDREYSQPYTTDASSAPTSDEEFFGHRVGLSHRFDPPPQIELNSPDSITESAPVPFLQESTEVKTEVKRHPSPYYYSDLLKPRVVDDTNLSQQQLLHSETLFSTKSECHPRNRYEFERQLLFQTTGADRSKEGKEKTKKNQKSWAGYHKKYRKTENSASNEKQRHSKQSQRAQQLALALLNDVGGTSTSSLSYPRAALDGEDDGVHDVEFDEMTRQRHVYETAFDSRVAKSDDDLDDIDKVTNHSVLSHIDPDRRLGSVSASLAASRSTSRCRSAFHQTDQSAISERAVREVGHTGTISGLSNQLEKMHIPVDGCRTMGAMPLRGYTPSPPSTAPLPTKFHGKEQLTMNSIRSAPNLPSHSKARLLKQLHLPIKTNTPEVRAEKDQRVLEIKDRPPRKDLLLFKRSKDGKGGTILEFKSRRRRHKYSSTESMTTSSSGGSMESIKSSTSEGNRSTTSTDSRNSSSLSSHDSDSGAASNYLAAQSSFQNKLHILSPISDKSSQEPVSEISDNNRNNNSQKCSPEEISNNDTKSRRRLPQNKNLLNLGLHTKDSEIQGSDSGISIQSRGEKSRFALGDLSSSGGQNNDFSDLPFDMPKLRRRRLAGLAAQEAACSSSATSIDFGDLPFDMPKLRRRLRVQQTPKELSMSQASSSQSVVDPEAGLAFRPKLSLNLDGGKQKPLGLSLSGIGFNSVKSPTRSELIDVNLPLEKQGWYHGAITRVEAENVLRVLREGSFLVRNSESTKQDYSLSLKSARGFMHMRIQREETNGTRTFILGQFSKPFLSIPEMIKHFSLNGLPIRGAEHMCLVQPVIVHLL